MNDISNNIHYNDMIQKLKHYAVLDSACNYNHIFNNIEVFRDFTSSDVNIIDCQGRKTTVNGRGTILIYLKSISPVKNIKLKCTNVIYNSNSPVNIISISCLHKNNIEVDLIKEQINITYSNKLYNIKIERLFDLYVIPIHFIKLRNKINK